MRSHAENCLCAVHKTTLLNDHGTIDICIEPNEMTTTGMFHAEKPIDVPRLELATTFTPTDRVSSSQEAATVKNAFSCALSGVCTERSHFADSIVRSICRWIQCRTRTRCKHTISHRLPPLRVRQHVNYLRPTCPTYLLPAPRRGRCRESGQVSEQRYSR